MHPVLLFLAIAAALTRPAAPAGVAWSTDLAAAKAQSAQTGRPVLVDFSATWCEPCQVMQKATFHDPAVVALMRKMICVHVDVDHDQADAQTFDVDGIPRVIVLSSKGHSLMDSIGFEDADTFADSLRLALGMKPTEGALAPGANPAIAAVQQALSSHSYGHLKAAKPKLAAQGLHEWVQELGDPSAAASPNTGELMAAGWPDTGSALLSGMGDKYLGVRAASYSAMIALMRVEEIRPPGTFDPWAKAPARANSLARWAAWWNRHKSAGPKPTGGHR